MLVGVGRDGATVNVVGQNGLRGKCNAHHQTHVQVII